MFYILAQYEHADLASMLVVVVFLFFIALMTFGILWTDKREQRKEVKRKAKTRRILQGQLNQDEQMEWRIIFTAKANGIDPYSYQTLVKETAGHIRIKTQEEADRWRGKATGYFKDQGITESELTFEVTYEQKEDQNGHSKRNRN